MAARWRILYPERTETHLFGRGNGQESEGGVGLLISIILDRIVTDASVRGQKDEFYDTLTVVLRNINRSDVVVLRGDFNAQFG